MSLPEITSDIGGMAGSSPKSIAAIAILRLYEKYWDQMATNKDFNIDRGTAAMIISCPEDKIRKEIWDFYIEEKKRTDETNASVLAVGKWYSYMADAMGLNEKSTGGW